MILIALTNQTYTNFEVIIAEDDEAESTKSFIQNFHGLEIKHVFHPDQGNQKTKIQNKAINISTGEYLIFIDGDTIPYRHFIEYQVAIAERKSICCGRRVNLPAKISHRLREGKLTITTLERYYWWFVIRDFLWNRTTRYEQGIQLDPSGIIYRYFMKNRERNSDVLGCNFSCYKDDMIAINGFDESYPKARLGDDIDLTWRFKMAGYSLKSSKNLANVFHLYHKKLISNYSKNSEKELMNERKEKRIFICENGLNQYV